MITQTNGLSTGDIEIIERAKKLYLELKGNQKLFGKYALIGFNDFRSYIELTGSMLGFLGRNEYLTKKQIWRLENETNKYETLYKSYKKACEKLNGQFLEETKSALEETVGFIENSDIPRDAGLNRKIGRAKMFIKIIPEIIKTKRYFTHTSVNSGINLIDELERKKIEVPKQYSERLQALKERYFSERKIGK